MINNSALLKRRANNRYGRQNLIGHYGKEVVISNDTAKKNPNSNFGQGQTWSLSPIPENEGGLGFFG